MHNMVLPYYENSEKDVEKKLKRYLNKIGKKLRWGKKKKENIFRFLNREIYRSAIEEIYEVMPSPYTVYWLQKDKKTCPCLLTCVVLNHGFNILRKYLSVSGKQKELSVTGLKNPEIIKVAV